MGLADRPPQDGADGEGAVLLADVTGSTALYRQIGNAAAAQVVNDRVAGMRAAIDAQGGVFVKAAGDDVLCWFAEADRALAAALRMLQPARPGDPEVHAGLQWGLFVHRQGDIFGDCVNAAARLCSLAKPREVLIGAECVARLNPPARAQVSEVAPVQLRGQGEVTRLFSALVGTGGATTRTVGGLLAPDAPQTVATIAFEEREWHLAEGQSLAIGREAGNAILVPALTVSRRHGTLTLSRGLLEYADHSSAGSFVMAPSGEEFAVFRRSVVLNGAGSISLAGPSADPAAPRLRYAVRARGA